MSSSSLLGLIKSLSPQLLLPLDVLLSSVSSSRSSFSSGGLFSSVGVGVDGSRSSGSFGVVDDWRFEEETGARGELVWSEEEEKDGFGVLTFVTSDVEFEIGSRIVTVLGRGREGRDFSLSISLEVEVRRVSPESKSSRRTHRLTISSNPPPSFSLSIHVLELRLSGSSLLGGFDGDVGENVSTNSSKARGGR